MSFLDTLLVDGNDVRAMTGLRVVGYMELFAPGERRGDDDEIPAVDGELGAPLPLAKYVLHVPIRILGATRGERNDNWRALGPLLAGTSTQGLVTLTRRIATGGGSSYVEHTARGRYISGLTMQIKSPFSGRSELQYYNLDGCWKSGATKYVP